MAINHALESYKKNDNDYIEGINSPHGRVTILFDTSLNHKDGGDIADNLVELYDYCRRRLSDYVQDKDIKKLDEVYSIINKLSDGWKAIDPKTKP